MYHTNIILKYIKDNTTTSTCWDIDITTNQIVVREYHDKCDLARECVDKRDIDVFIKSRILTKQRRGKFSALERNNFIDEVKKVKYLPDNWDGYGAKSISTGVVYSAICFLRLIPNIFFLPQLDISADDEIIFTWEQGMSTLDISFELNGNIRCYTRLEKKNGEVRHIHKKMSIQKISKSTVEKMLGA